MLKSHNYSKYPEFNSLEKYVWEGLNNIGRTIPQIQDDDEKGRIIQGDQNYAKIKNKPVWHNKPELDKFVARSLNLNPDEYYKDKNKKDKGQNAFYKAVANEIGRLRRDGSIIDWRRDNHRTGVWKLDKVKLQRYADTQASLEIKKRNFYATGSESTIHVRAKQSAFRNALFKEYCKCVLCGFKIPEYMIGAHIVPYSVMREKEPENAMNPTDGLLLCRFCDVAFDKGTIMIEEDFGIIISGQLKERREEIVKAWLAPIPSELNIRKNAKYPPDAKYLKWKKELIKNKQN